MPKFALVFRDLHSHFAVEEARLVFFFSDCPENSVLPGSPLHPPKLSIFSMTDSCHFSICCILQMTECDYGNECEREREGEREREREIER